MKRTLFGIFIGIFLVLFVPWAIGQCKLPIEVKGTQGNILLWNLLNLLEGFSYGFAVHWYLNYRREQKKTNITTVLLCLLCLLVSGCANFQENVSSDIPANLKNFRLGEFTGSDPALAQMFARTVKEEFEQAGFTLDGQHPDFVLTGIALETYTQLDWILMATNPASKDIASVRLKPGFGQTPTAFDRSKQLSQRMIGLLNARQAR